MRRIRLRNHDIDALDSRAASPVLTGDDDLVASSHHRRSEIPEMPIRLNIGYFFPIDYQRGARFGAPDHLDDVALQLGAVDIKHHFLFLALGHKGELIRIARIADVVLVVDGANPPEVIPRFEAGNVDGGCSGLSFDHNVSETRRRARLKIILL